MGIKHERVVAPEDRGMAADWNADHIIDGDVDFNQHESLDHVVENRTDYPAGPVVGQIIYRTDTKTLEIWNGSSWTNLMTDKVGCTFVVAASDSKNTLRADYVCDGTDDQVEINQAITDLPAGGGRIILLEGEYDISSQITISKDNVTLQGQGFGTYLNVDSDIYGIAMVLRSEIVLRDFRLVQTANWGASSEGINIQGCTNIKIIHLHVKDFEAYQLRTGASGLTDCFNIEIKNCYFDGRTGGCVAIADTKFPLITGCFFTDPTLDGLVLSVCDWGIISNNRVYNIGRDGIRLISSTENIIESSVLENVGNNWIELDNTIRCMVHGNMLIGGNINIIAGVGNQTWDNMT